MSPSAGDEGVVVDSSAVMAVLLLEPQAEALASAFADAPVRLVSAATVVEVGIVAESRAAQRGRAEVRRFVDRCTVVPVDEATAAAALDGWRRFGKGTHPAALNFGDCFTYALAKRSGLPVLCVGDDFVRTDVSVVDLATTGPDDPEAAGPETRGGS